MSVVCTVLIKFTSTDLDRNVQNDLPFIQTRNDWNGIISLKNTRFTAIRNTKARVTSRSAWQILILQNPCLQHFSSRKFGSQYIDKSGLPSLTCPRLVVVLSQHVLVSGSQQNPSVRSRVPPDHQTLLEFQYLGLGHRPGTLSNDQPVTGRTHRAGQRWRVRPTRYH